MIPFGLAHWLGADDDTRLVILDALLEHLPGGYRSLRDSGHRLGAFPRFVHDETGVTFDAVLGGRAWFGMTERRWQRVVARYALWAPGQRQALERRDVAHLMPAREVQLAPALVADSALPFSLLKRFGLEEARLGSASFEPRQLDAVLRAVTRLGWRAPSEAEWEYALRAAHGDLADGGAIGGPASPMGRQPELCRDDFHDTLAGYPEAGSRGNGHEVLRGASDAPSFVASAAAAEVLWPGRRRLADVTGRIGFRPWVDLVR